MRAAADLGRARDIDGPIGLLYVPIDRRPKRALSFKEAGFSFIELRPQHLNLMSAIYGGRSVPTIDEVVGKAMVDDFHLPLGVVLVYFAPDTIEVEYGQRFRGRCWLYAHFGKWLRIYPKDILRGTSEVADELRAAGVFILHCSADESIEGSDKLASWLGAEPTGEYEEGLGPIYQLDLRNCKI
jgi:hypothetical protein